nr:uncharacterized protein LOC111511016 [Leptinotarsa decemlineata]
MALTNNGKKILCVLLTITTITIATRQHRTPSSTYHQETDFPSSKNYLEGSLTFDKHPVHVSAGFHLKPPPRVRVPSLPPLDFLMRREPFPRPPFSPSFLFIPNTIEQTAETKGQIEEYEKALREERLEQGQDRATTQGRFSEVEDLEGTTQPTHFVSVRGKEYNYNYSV